MSDKGILAWFASNHVVANMLMIFLLAAGLFSVYTIKKEVFPEFDSDIITIRVPYLGASPAEVEEGVCMRVEEAIAGIEGIKRIRSTSGEGIGTVSVELQEDSDTAAVLDDIKASVDRIETFPEETEKPVVAEAVRRRQVISIVLFGDVPEKTLKMLSEDVRDELTAMEEISQVEIAGTRRFEISIEVSEQTLRRHGLSFAQVADKVRKASLDLPGGAVKTAGGEILIRTKGQRYTRREFADIVMLTNPDGTELRLGEMATIVDGFEDSDIVTRFDGKPAAQIQVFRVGDQGALKISRIVREYAEARMHSLPQGVSMATWQDDARILRSRISLLVRNGRVGLLLVFLCLLVFLNFRLAFWTAMGIPISFLGAFWLLPHLGVSVNMLSLFAFVVSLGLVVDDAIVVGENIFDYRKKGMPHLQAAVRGVQEMAVPVTFAILTTVAAFLPLMFVEGRTGKIMRQIPIVVIVVLAISLVEALLILPAHLSNRKEGKEPSGLLSRVNERVGKALDQFVYGPYKRMLQRAVAWRYLTVCIGGAAFLLTVGYVAGGHIKFTFMPKIDADNMVAALTMPQGIPIEETRSVIHRLEEAAEKVRSEFDSRRKGGASVFRHVSSSIGQQPYATRRSIHGSGGGAGSVSRSHLAEVNVELLSSEERNVRSDAMVRRWRELSGDVPGAVSLTFTSSLFSTGDAVSVELAHRDFSALLNAVRRLKDELGRYPGVNDVADSFLPGKQELKLQLTPLGRAAGITWADLARQARQGFYGEEVQRIQRGRDDVRVMVRYPDAFRRSVFDIERMRIRLPDGKQVPFATVATLEEGRGYAEINRTDRRRVVSVTADVNEKVANANEINGDLRMNLLPRLAKDFPGLTFSFEGQQRQQKETMQSLARNFIISQLGIFALLAIPLKRYSQPLIVMSAIPFGLVGAVLGHIIMGLNLSLLSMFGIVALTGVVVNDSLIMIDLINRQRSEGLPLAEVIVNSGTRRFRPILLTTLTTFFGLTPIILETSVQAQFLIPMAVSLGFGVVFSTAITLLLVPALYSILEDVKSKAASALGRMAEA